MSEAIRFDHSPFMRFLGLEVVRAEKGVIEVRLPFREEFLRHDGSDWLHGGVVSSLADIVGDYAVITETGQGVPTIDLRVDYLRPARRGDLLAVGRTLRVGKTVSVATWRSATCPERWSRWAAPLRLTALRRRRRQQTSGIGQVQARPPGPRPKTARRVRSSPPILRA